MIIWPIEKQLIEKGMKVVCGMDEAGRGPLAGPVVCAAVVIPPGLIIKGLNDSKKLTPAKREALAATIKEKCFYGIGVVSHDFIDKFGIKKATFFGFHQAVKNLPIDPECLLIDGIDDFHFEFPAVSIEKGDERIRCIQAASIIAKVERDRIMREVDKDFPVYGFGIHKGYGTRQHYSNINKYGLSPIHRKTFCDEPVNLR